MMSLSWNGIRTRLGEFAPVGSPKRKLLQLVALILVLEGVATIFLSSYFGLAWGVLSVAIGGLVLLLFPPGMAVEKERGRAAEGAEVPDTYGIQFVDLIMKKIGNEYVVMGIGAAVIILDVIYNTFFSRRPDYGDLDTLSIMFGGILLVYPFAVSRFKVEITFALLFVAFVMIILVVPQSVIALSGDSGSSAGNWYVHYMLAAPMAGALNLLGVDASSAQEYVTITFRDGSINTLGISTACAGLYSFSIFVSAFFAFCLVFERLPARLTAIVMGVGLVIAYLGNLFRMVIIGLTGYYHGMDALQWAHKNVGWMVFLGWSVAFWYLVMRFADRRSHPRSKVRAA